MPSPPRREKYKNEKKYQRDYARYEQKLENYMDTIEEARAETHFESSRFVVYGGVGVGGVNLCSVHTPTRLKMCFGSGFFDGIMPSPPRREKYKNEKKYQRGVGGVNLCSVHTGVDEGK
jgi:hypothetical protein